MDKHIPIKRWQVIKKVIDGEITLRDACTDLGLSYRQALRIKKTVIENGVRGCIHGNTGRHPSNMLSERVHALIVELSCSSAAALTDSALSDILRREHNITLSRESVRKIRRAHDIAPQKTRPSALQAPGGGRPREGRCMFWDGMLHQWFPSGGYASCLIAAIDDASGRCLAARFFPFEESAVYLWALQHVVKTHGIPRQIIQDCSTLLKPSERSMSIEEQLRGAPDPTQVGNAVQSLGIQPVFVTTRRQKRYFQRVFEQLHISLIEALNEHSVTDLQAGNRFLDEYFIEQFNHRSALAHCVTGSSWQKPSTKPDVERLCSFLYEGAREINGAVRIGNVTIALKKQSADVGRDTLEVRQMLDGSWRVYMGSTVIGRHAPTPLLEPLRTKTAVKRNTTRTAGYSWTYPSGRM
jgi:transposase